MYHNFHQCNEEGIPDDIRAKVTGCQVTCPVILSHSHALLFFLSHKCSARLQSAVAERIHYKVLPMQTQVKTRLPTTNRRKVRDC